MASHSRSPSALSRSAGLQPGALREGLCVSCGVAIAPGISWQPASPYSLSPYLEDLTKSLVTAAPPRRKIQLVPSPLRVKSATVSPYEPLRDTARARQLRAQLQAEVALRHHRLLWDREAATAAARVGVDISTYNMLMMLQHRDITPEDYDMLQQLDASTKPKTLSQRQLDELLPSWTVPPPASEETEPLCEPCRRPPPEHKCYICLERLESGQQARTLPCEHMFHASCIGEWLTKNSHVCPVDHSPVVPEDELE